MCEHQILMNKFSQRIYRDFSTRYYTFLFSIYLSIHTVFCIALPLLPKLTKIVDEKYQQKGRYSKSNLELNNNIIIIPVQA